MGAGVAAATGGSFVGFMLLFKKLDEFFCHRTSKLRSIGNGDGALVVARYVVANADGNQFDRRVIFDLVNDLAQVLFEVAA